MVRGLQSAVCSSSRTAARPIVCHSFHGDASLLSALCPSVRALKTIVSTQHTIIVLNTPPQPQWSAIQPTPVPAIAEPKT